MQNVKIWSENALTDIFRYSHCIKASPAELHMAKNEYESFQLAVRATTALSDVTIDVHPVEGIHFSVSRIREVFTPVNNEVNTTIVRAKAPCMMPEYYDNTNHLAVLDAHETYSFAVEARTTAETGAGTYKTNVTVSYSECGERKRREVPVTITVYNVTIPEAKDSQFGYTCWFNSVGSSEFAEWYPRSGLDESGGYNDATWEILKNFASVMKKQRQNTIWVPVAELVVHRLKTENGRYKIDWSDFDRYITTFAEYGAVKYLEGQHILNKNWLSPEPWSGGMTITWVFSENDDGGFCIKNVLSDTEEGLRHIDDFYPQLREHLIEKGWNRMWLQHVCDEPVSARVDGGVQVESVKRMYERIKTEWEWRTFDAGGNQIQRFGNLLTDPVPQLDNYEGDDWSEESRENKSIFRSANNKEGIRVWMYTCVNPRRDFMSRLGDYPLMSTRILYWYSFSEGFHGYLHWAWNLWSFAGRVRRKGESVYDNLDSFEHAVGDTHLVYPDSYGLSVYEGPRASAVRDGLEDYEILVLAAEKEPGAVKRIVEELARSGSDFERDPRKLLEKRIEILKIAES